MTYLLDVSTIIALIRTDHVNHQQASAWAKGRKLAICPITELGFIRISTGPTFNASMDDARRALRDFMHDVKTDFIPCDQSALDGHVAMTSGKTTDWYLANLAEKHGMRWATLDMAAKHPVAEFIG